MKNFLSEDTNQFKCGVCGTALRVTKLECPNSQCGCRYSSSIFPNIFAFITAEEVEVVKALIANDGNLSKAAGVLGLTKTKYKEKLNVLKTKMQEGFTSLMFLSNSTENFRMKEGERP